MSQHWQQPDAGCKTQLWHRLVDFIPTSIFAFFFKNCLELTAKLQ